MKITPTIANLGAFGFRWTARATIYLLMGIIAAVPVARADWVVNGSAYISGSQIVVTPNSGNQVGSAWLDRRIDLSRDFDITLSVNMGSNDAGADGLSVVFHNDPRGLSAVGGAGAGGEWIGMHTILPALSVEIDTYQNAGRGDPTDDHIAINEFRTAADGPNHGGAAPVSLGNVEDGADHLLRLVWDSAAHTLSAYFAGTQRIIYTKNIVAEIFSGASQVWFGVAGSTGGSYNLQRFQPLIVNSALTIGKSAAPGSVDAGAAVTYTLTIRNTSAIPATVSQIVDQLPAGFNYIAGTTAGLTDNDPIIGGETLTWTGHWRIEPGQTRTFAFEAFASTVPSVYHNSITVRGNDFADLDTGPTAPVIVIGSPVPASGNKSLYLHSNPDTRLSRTPPTASQPNVTINGRSASTWTLRPPLSTALRINGDSGRITVELNLSRTVGVSSRTLSVALFSSSIGLIGTTGDISPNLTTSTTNLSFAIPISGDILLPEGDTLSLTISNHTTQTNRGIHVAPIYGNNNSRVILNSRNVIHVDEVIFSNAPYPAAALISSAVPGQSVWIRAKVSDPFGSFDISSAALQWIRPAGTPAIDQASMTEVFDSGGAIKIYEYAVTLPSSGAEGIWTAWVTAEEGTEGEIRHTGVGMLQTATPEIFLLKTVTVFSDPVNGSTHAKSIPGALMQYTMTAINQGGGSADGDSVVLVDPVPANTALFVGDLEAPGSGPVAFSDGNPPSGLTYTFNGLGNLSDDIDFSRDGGGTWTYSPMPDGNEVDSAVTHIRINPKGGFNGAASGGHPSFTLRLRLRVH